MKEEKPFNPVLTLNLNLPISESAPPNAEPLTTDGKTSHTRRRPNPKRRLVHKVRRVSTGSWNRIKGGLHVRLAHLNSVQLKRVLVACGIAASVALIIIALAKHLALIVVLLAILGLMVLIRLWNRIVTLGL